MFKDDNKYFVCKFNTNLAQNTQKYFTKEANISFPDILLSLLAKEISINYLAIMLWSFYCCVVVLRPR